MKILMATWDCGGNIPPFLGLGAELVKKGHQVACLTSGVLEPRFAKVGVELIPAQKKATFDPLAKITNKAWEKEILDLWFGGDFPNELLKACHKMNPDVLVIDYCLSSALAATEAMPIPTVVLVHTLPGRILSNWNKNLLGFANEARSRYNLETVNSAEQLWSNAGTTIVTSFETLDGMGVASGVRELHYIGPISEPLDADATVREVQLRDERPNVLVSFSTTFMEQEASLCEVMEAISQFDVNGLVTTGPSVEPDALPEISNISKHKYLPHELIMPQMSVAIVHAGHGSVTKALKFGVPLLCMPLGRDQMYVSERISALGAGIYLDSAAPAPEISKALRELLNAPSYQTKAQELGDELKLLGAGEVNGSRYIELATEK